MYDTNLQRLLDAFPTAKSVKVHRAALWILGEYASTPDDIQAVMNQVRQTLGEVVINNFVFSIIFVSYNIGSKVLKSSGSCLENREYGRRDPSR
jgi:hypothetical protein